MKILIYGLHFKPDLIGIGKYTGEMADWLFEQGHDVRVVTAPHFYPEWNLGKSSFFYSKNKLPFTTWRCPIYVPKHPSGIKRILHSFSFAISSFPILVRNLSWKPKIIISIEPPFLTSPATLLFSFLTRSKSILHIQDLEIDAAYNLNFIKKGFLYKYVIRFEKFVLSRFDVISTISSMMKKHLVKKGITEDNIYILLNWADIHKINPFIKNDYLRKRFFIKPTKKVILYSGNIGEKQNFDIVINVAKKLQSNNEKFLFLIVGDGSVKRRLITIIKEQKINNIIFKPLVPTEDLGALLTLADIHLIIQDSNIADLVLPSKLTNILSAGGVSIIAAKTNTQLARLVQKYNIGYRINSGSEPELFDAIIELISNKSMCDKISKNARRYAEKSLAKNTILNEFENSILLN